MDILSEVDDPDERAELFALAGDHPGWAIQRLRERGLAAVPGLIAALREDSLGGVASGRMLSLLAETDAPQALEPAIAGLADPRSQVRWAAREALGVIPGQQATDALIRLLSDPSADVVMHVAGILGLRRDKQAVGPLTDLLSSADAFVRYSAVRALAQIGGAEARRALTELGDREDDKETRELIAKTLSGQQVS